MLSVFRCYISLYILASRSEKPYIIIPFSFAHCLLLLIIDDCSQEDISRKDDGSFCEDDDESKAPLQLAIVGRPNVGKSTLLNMLLQEDRVLVGLEAGLTRDSVRAQFEFDGRTVFLVNILPALIALALFIFTGSNTAIFSYFWCNFSCLQSRKNLTRAHVVALVLNAEEIANAKRSMTHAEVVIARRAVEEGCGLVVIVNKMDVLSRKKDAALYDKVKEAVSKEIQTVIPQVTGIAVVFISAIEGKGHWGVMRQVIDTYDKWCIRLSTARLNRWLRKVMSRHSWKDQTAQPKVKYFTQVKARPPTFVVFMSGKTELLDTDLRFLTKSLKEDFDLCGIPIRIMQRSVARRDGGSSSKGGSGRSVVLGRQRI